MSETIDNLDIPLEQYLKSVCQSLDYALMIYRELRFGHEVLYK